MKKILFLYKNFMPEEHWNCLKAQEKNIGAIPPLNLCYVAAVARLCGYDVELIDLQVEPYSDIELLNRILDINPTYLAFTITTYMFRPMKKWILSLKKALNIPVLVGGYHFSIYPAILSAYKDFDYYFIPSDNKSLVSFFYNLQNIKFDNKKNAKNNVFPFPARDLLKNELYGNFISKRKNFTAMLSGTGCPFSCKYCTSKEQEYFLRDYMEVVEEIEECYYKYKIREIDFYDQTFTINKKRVNKICDEIIKRELDIIWTIRTRADLLDNDLIEKMKRAGLYRVMLGIESAAQDILNRINKKEKIENVIQTIKLLKKNKIEIFGFFMLGCPGENKETLSITKKFMLTMPFDDIQVTRFTLFPGTDFYREYLRDNKEIDYWEQYILGDNETKALPLLDTKFTTRQIDKEVKKSYLSFYLRPRIFFKKLLYGNIFLNFWKYIKALLDMLRE